METVIKKRGSGYHIQWIEGIECYVSRIRENPDRIKCEVAILLNGEPLTRSSPVLNSESGKDSLIRKLKRRRPQEDFNIDWEAIIEELCGLVIDSHREGEAVLEISQVPQENSLTWRVEGILPEGNACLVYGDGGSGKSYYATYLAVLMDQGYLNTDLNMTIEPGRVLYMDWETDEFEISSRVKSIHRGLNIDKKSGILYRRCSQSLIAEVDRIVDIVAQKKVDVLIADSLGLATGGNLEEAESTLAFFQALRMIGKTSLVISHTNKAGQSFGSVYATNSSRMCWFAEGTPSDDGSGIDLSLFHKKANNVATQSDMGWHLQFDDDLGVTFSPQDVIDTASAGKMTIPRIIFEILRKQGEQTKEELREAVASKKAMTPESIKPAFNTALTRLKQAGKIQVSKDRVGLSGLEEGTWEV